MDSSVVLALPGDILSTKVISSNNNIWKDTLLLVSTKYKLFIVAGDGNIKSEISINAPCTTKKLKSPEKLHIVDAEFIPSLTSLLLALSDSSLLHVPLLSSVSERRDENRVLHPVLDCSHFERFAWPNAPKLLSSLGKTESGRAACLVQTSNSAAVIFLSDSGSSPVAPDETRNPAVLSLISAHSSGTISALVTNTNNSNTLMTWSLVSEGWLDTTTALSCPLDVPRGYEFLGIYTTKTFTSLTLHSKEHDKGVLWMKCAKDSTLFTRNLGRNGIQGKDYVTQMERDGSTELFFIDENKCITSWCSRYGIVKNSWLLETNKLIDSNDFLSSMTKRGHSNNISSDLQSSTDPKVDESSSSLLEFCKFTIDGTFASPRLYCVNTSNGSSSLIQIQLESSTANKNGLLNALGTLDVANSESVPAISRLSRFGFKLHTTNSKIEPVENGTPTSQGKGVLAALPRPLKRRLQQATQWRVKHASGIKKLDNVIDGDDETKPRKRSRDCMVPSFEAGMAFLQKLQENSSPDGVLASDWDVVRTLLTTKGCVSLQKPYNTSLLEFSLAAGRLDVLCCAVRYASDLTEVQAVSALIGLSKWDTGSKIGQLALDHLRISDKGVLEWYAKSSISNTGASDDSGTRKRRGKVSVVAQETDVAIMRGKLSHSDLLRILTESLLRRSNGFSVPLLVDAIREYASPSIAGVLLQLFLLFLRGFGCPTDGSFFGFVHDQQIVRAVDWVEAILDAHFCEVALSSLAASADQTGSLVSALKVAEEILPQVGISKGEEALEEVIGAWTHVSRSVRRLRETREVKYTQGNLRPPDGLYRMENIVF